MLEGIGTAAAHSPAMGCPDAGLGDSIIARERPEFEGQGELGGCRTGESGSVAAGGAEPRESALGTGHSDGGEVDLPGGTGLLVGGRFRLGVCWD